MHHVDLEAVTEQCLEVTAAGDPDTPGAQLTTGEPSGARAGYEDGESVQLACGEASVTPAG